MFTALIIIIVAMALLEHLYLPFSPPLPSWAFICRISSSLP